MLFNYNTLKVDLDSETKSVHVYLNRPNVQNAINSEMIFELESLMTWMTAHLEVNSILLSSTSSYFCKGLDYQELATFDNDKLKKLLTKFQKIIHGMLHLSQTIVCDLKEGARGIGIELALGADLRIANENCILDFDHLQQGLVPTCGGVALLGQLIGNSLARQWTLGSIAVTANKLAMTGLIVEEYDQHEDITHDLLEEIAAQAPVARIQAKRSFLEAILPEQERALVYESNFAFASLATQDWKKAALASISKEKVAFTSPRDLAEIIKAEKEPKENLQGPI